MGEESNKKMSRHPTYDPVLEYEEEINIFMKRQEKERYILHFSSPQLRYREDLLNKMIAVVNKLHVSERTLHSAVYILDAYMDCHDIYAKRLELVSFACISIAAKYEEIDDKTSKALELLHLMKEKPRRGLFMKMEFMILKFMQWKFLPTAVHFADYYVQYAISEDDVSYTYSSRDELMIAFRQYLKMLLKVALIDQRLMNEPRSLIGAACIAAARGEVALFPMWPNQLVQVSGYKDYQVCAYAKLLVTRENETYAGEHGVYQRPYSYCDNYTIRNNQPSSSNVPLSHIQADAALPPLPEERPLTVRGKRQNYMSRPYGNCAGEQGRYEHPCVTISYSCRNTQPPSSSCVPLSAVRADITFLSLPEMSITISSNPQHYMSRQNENYAGEHGRYDHPCVTVCYCENCTCTNTHPSSS